MTKRLCDQEIAPMVTWLARCIVPSSVALSSRSESARPFVVFSVTSKREQHDDQEVF